MRAKRAVRGAGSGGAGRRRWRPHWRGSGPASARDVLRHGDDRRGPHAAGEALAHCTPLPAVEHQRPLPRGSLAFHAGQSMPATRPGRHRGTARRPTNTRTPTAAGLLRAANATPCVLPSPLALPGEPICPSCRAGGSAPGLASVLAGYGGAPSWRSSSRSCEGGLVDARQHPTGDKLRTSKHLQRRRATIA
jgi:hypothetical protein